jgi:signal transduction histidine kinase
VAVAAMALSRKQTSWALVLGLIVAGLGVATVASGSPSNLAWFGTCVLAGWCALRAGGRPTFALTALLVAGFVAEWVAYPDYGWLPWLAGLLFTVIVCLMARRQADLVDQLRSAQAGLAERAAADERARIARELHDVIGHALTVSLLHVTSARLALREDTVEAERALAEAERLGQQSLAEVRHVVGLLRETHSEGRTPLPGAAQLDELVEGFRRTGTPLAWEVVADPAALSATSGLTVYRILQEALTNVARHAPGSRTTARLVVEEATAELVVDSAGAVGDGSTPGAGLAGMRERAEAIGGTLTAGPFNGGWRVRAVLPT